MNSLQCVSAVLHKADIVAANDKLVKNFSHRRGETFNVFQVCGVDYYEHAHSVIIAELLNPRGSHGQGDVFLALFLKQLEIESEGDEFFSQFKTENAGVSTEVSVSEGRLDILIENNRQAIIIENKIYAADGDAQLARYADSAKNIWKEQFRLVYLTLEGNDASEQSAKRVEYLKASYSSTITNWLKDCLQYCYDKPILRESLIQYNNHITQLTGKIMDQPVNNELLDLMTSYPEAVAKIIQSKDEWEKAILEEKLMKPLEDFAKSNGMTFSYELYYGSKKPYGGFNFELSPGLCIAFEYERGGWRNWYYGVVDEREMKREIHPLPSLEGGNEKWRYGWHYLDIHRNWAAEDIAQMATDGGKFLEYITDAVKKIRQEVEDEKLL